MGAATRLAYLGRPRRVRKRMEVERRAIVAQLHRDHAAGGGNLLRRLLECGQTEERAGQARRHVPVRSRFQFGDARSQEGGGRYDAVCHTQSQWLAGRRTLPLPPRPSFFIRRIRAGDYSTEWIKSRGPVEQVERLPWRGPPPKAGLTSEVPRDQCRSDGTRSLLLSLVRLRSWWGWSQGVTRSGGDRVHVVIDWRTRARF